MTVQIYEEPISNFNRMVHLYVMKMKRSCVHLPDKVLNLLCLYIYYRKSKYNYFSQLVINMMLHPQMIENCLRCLERLLCGVVICPARRSSTATKNHDNNVVLQMSAFVMQSHLSTLKCFGLDSRFINIDF